MEEALTISEQCENARETLQRDCVSTFPAAQLSAGAPAVHSVSVTDKLQKAIDRLTEEMCSMRVEMMDICDENRKLKAGAADRRERGFRSPSGGRCGCSCGEWGCQSRGPRDGRSGRSPDRRPFQPQDSFQPRDHHVVPPVFSHPTRQGGRSPSPSWRARHDGPLT